MKYNVNVWVMILYLICLGVCETRAARVDTLKIESLKMGGKKVETLVVVPEGATDKNRCPVLYLLHGYGGNARTWLTIKPELCSMADRDGIMVVCPDGRNSWYWDSPLHADSQYETFVTSELLDYIDAHYPTQSTRKSRAITGLSMGGHGALWLAIRHQELFGAAGSTSGGVDIRPFPDSWEMKNQLGERNKFPEVWDSHTVIMQLDGLRDGSLALIIDCGTDDFFFEVNKALHLELLKRKISHDFIVRPGAHNSVYWNNSIDYQWLFFKKYFISNLADD